MDINEFNFKYAFILFNDEKLNVKIYFYPTSGHTNKGGMNTTFSDGKVLSGEYALNTLEDGSFEISWLDVKFLFVPADFGFNLVNPIDATVTYSFTRPIL